MDILRRVADHSIRRALGFAALGTAMVMLAFSYDLVLAFRAGAVLTSLICAALWLRAAVSRWRNIRETEMWTLLAHERRHLTRAPFAPCIASKAAQVLRERLLWHAERVALAAFAMWLCTGAAALLLWAIGVRG